MRKAILLPFLLAACITLTFVAAAQQSAVSSATATSPTAVTPSQPSVSSKSGRTAGSKTTSIRVEPSLRIEGEKRFRANCSRCHMAPQKLPPRAAATIIRHMRVRATITDEDMRYILAYLAQ